MKNYQFIKKPLRFCIILVSYSLMSGSLSGCWLVAAGAGAEAAYVTTQKDRTAGETIGDQVITTKIKSLLLADSDIPGLDINVDTHNSEVTLKGVVASQKVADKAISVAQSVDGVKLVISKLVLETKIQDGRYY